MARNLAASIRYQVIDRCLRNTGRQYTICDLQEECGKALYEAIGKTSNPSERTIRKDFADMQNGTLGYFAPIVNVRINPKKLGYYKYSDSNFSIKNFSLKENEVKALKECLHILRHFSEFDFQIDAMKSIKKLMEEIRPELDNNEPPIIGFDRVTNAEGWKLIGTMYKAIQDKRVLKFEYRPFRNEPIRYFEEFHPYYLHEYNNRWFLFGFCKDENKIRKFSLDRMHEISYPDVPFIKNTSFDTEKYFQNRLGVSDGLDDDSSIEEVVLSFPKAKGLYVLTKPIHPTQEKLYENSNEIHIKLKLMINYELVREVVSFMGGVKVMSPPRLQQKVMNVFTDCLKQYEAKPPAIV